jgi:predicted nucleotidyltransferase
MDELKKYLKDIALLCSRYKVNKLYAFGSILTTNYKANSDVDFIVDFQPLDILQYADNYYDLKFDLENVLNRRVDLLEEKTIKNPFFQQVVNNKRQLVYER